MSNENGSQVSQGIGSDLSEEVDLESTSLNYLAPLSLLIGKIENAKETKSTSNLNAGQNVQTSHQALSLEVKNALTIETVSCPDIYEYYSAYIEKVKAVNDKIPAFNKFK